MRTTTCLKRNKTDPTVKNCDLPVQLKGKEGVSSTSLKSLGVPLLKTSEILSYLKEIVVLLRTVYQDFLVHLKGTSDHSSNISPAKVRCPGHQ